MTDTDQETIVQPQTGSENKGRKGRRRASFRFLLFVLTAALVPVAYAGWSEIYINVLEGTPPRIEEVGLFPRGVGIAPVSIRLRLKDIGSGLDEVVIRTRQRGKVKEVLRKKLERRSEFEIEVTFPGRKSKLEEGPVDIIVRAFDSSLWSNRAEKIYRTTVDYRKPEVEVLSTQHNAIQGGSQLVFYRAYDETLAVSGVKVGSRTFLGFKAKGLDPGFADQENLFVAIYAIDAQEDVDNLPVKVFAEDNVGNAVSKSFYNKIAKRQWHHLSVGLNETFMRDRVANLADTSLEKLQEWSGKLHGHREYKTENGSDERLIEQFQIVNTELRQLNYSEVEKKLRKRASFEKQWDGAFLKQNGVTRTEFGHIIDFSFDKKPIGELFVRGYNFGLPAVDKSVLAANDGIVVFSENIGVYGRVLAIDHGLGLFSLYAHLDTVLVSDGDKVEFGDTIAYGGKTGFADQVGVYFEMWVQNVQVNPREWFDRNWYQAHVVDKMNSVKKDLGIAVYSPFSD